MLGLIATIIVASIIVYIFISIKDPEPVFGIYKKCGKWYPIKYCVFLMLYHYRRWMTTSSSSADASKPNDKAGHGVKSHSTPEDMDKAQPLSDHAKAFDAAFFIGANKDGFYMTAGTERRQMGIINGLFYFIIPGKGVLCSPKIPDTMLFGAQINEFGAEGLLLTPITPMKKWLVSYSGKMWYQHDPTVLIDVNFNAEWEALHKYFDYDTDLCASAVARSIARETWTKKYFKDLKAAHQSHYEQFGIMKVNATVGEEKYTLTMDAFRDHSYGHKRDWELMHRYAFHHIFLADGRSIAVGVICQPCTASSFEVGVIYSPKNKIQNRAVESCDLQLYQHGENGKAPKDYAFSFVAGGMTYEVQVEVEHESEHFVSSHWDARMVERFAKFTVNGVKGWGVTEFHYNNKSDRPEKYTQHDPDWYQMLRHN